MTPDGSDPLGDLFGTLRAPVFHELVNAVSERPKHRYGGLTTIGHLR